LPLVKLVRRAQNAKTPLDRHQIAYYLWEAALKLPGSRELGLSRKAVAGPLGTI
jgi:hypothetical protein